MARSFVLARQAMLPGWIDDETGRAYQEAQGVKEDSELALLKSGVLATLIDSAPDDALDVIGTTLSLPRFIKESNDHYRARLSVAWDTHERRGTREGITGILADMQIVDVDIREDYEWSTFGDWFTRFWAFAGPDFGPALGTVGLTTPFETGDATTTVGGSTMGSTAVRAEVLQMTREIVNWKSPTAYPVHLIMVFEDGAVQGIVSTPFVTTEGGAAYVPIGKVQGMTVTTAPFTPGGFYG